MNKPNLKNIGIVDLETIASEIYKEPSFFRFKFSDIAKHFLDHFFHGIFDLNFIAIHKLYVEEVGDSVADIPNTEEIFFKFICLTYLELEREPCLAMLEQFEAASIDIFNLDRIIAECAAQIKALEAVSTEKKEDGHEYRIRLYKHYVELNRQEKAQIVEFITTDKIRDFAFYDCKTKTDTFSLLFQRIPYAFRIFPKRFDPKFTSDFGNKFEHLERHKRKEISDLFKAQDPVFVTQASEYYEKYKFLAEIERLIDSNHCLHNRKTIFVQAISAYKAGNYALFISVIALQIEGIFYDYCIQLGMDEHSLRNTTLSSKMDEIKKRIPDFRDYVYYNFRFPIVRNRIAHGKLIDNVEILAAYLVHDFYNMCRLMNGSSVPLNNVIRVIDLAQFKKDKIALVRYALFLNFEIPIFYDRNNHKIELNAILNTKEFLDYLVLLINKENKYLNAGIWEITKILMKNNIQKEEAIKVRRLIPAERIEYNQSEFLEQLSMVEE